jgi:DNA-binding response OmpR family regulator
MKNILIVEDDIHLGFLLMEFLEQNNYQVKLCRDGESGFSSFKNGNFDICILDVMLPEMDGYTLARQIKKVDKDIPFLFLTARSMKEDKLQGFSCGAEDYITKPFEEDELLCRIKVILRRQASAEKPTAPTRFKIGAYQFDFNRRELCYGEVSLRLTEKESEVLRLLCLNKNQVLKRDEAVEKIYGKQDYFLGRSFDVFISRIRKLLQNDDRISIDNVFKVGFILNVKEEQNLAS